MSVEEEFSRFIAEHGESVQRSARLLAGDWHAGEDLAQEALTRLFLAWPRLRAQDAALSYVYRTMARLQARLSSRRRTREQLGSAVPESAYCHASSHDEELLHALVALTPGQRSTLVLRFFADMSVEEVVRTMGCSAGTVKSQTARGLNALRRVLHAPEELHDARH